MILLYEHRVESSVCQLAFHMGQVTHLWAKLCFEKYLICGSFREKCLSALSVFQETGGVKGNPWRGKKSCQIMRKAKMARPFF